MTRAWLQAFQELQRFINSNPSVEITENLVSIDEKARPKFYELFDRVRGTFLSEHLSPFLEDATALSTEYLKTERTLIERLRLNGVLMPPELRRFLENPSDQISRDLFDPLFELLRENIEPAEFEEIGALSVCSTTNRLYEQAFNKWATLVLLLALEPEEVFEVPLPEPSSKEVVKHRVGDRMAVPFPFQTNELCFEVKRRGILMAPDFIIRSALLSTYVAFRTEVSRAIWSAAYYPEEREWFDLATMVEDYGPMNLDPDVLLYVDDNLENIALVADAERFCRPDICVQFPERISYQNDTWVEEIKNINLCHIVLKPVAGSCVLARERVIDSMANGLIEGIRRFPFGLHHRQVKPVLDLLRH